MDTFKFYRVLFVALVTFGFTTISFAEPYTSGRIIPSGKVLIKSGDQLVGEYSEEAPLPLQSVLTCSGDCAVRMTNLFARVKEDTYFSVDETPEVRSLLIKEGALFFVMPKLVKPLVIATQAGVVTMEQAFIKTANQGENVLSGYIKVKNDRTEIGVIEGGALVVSTSDGQSTIQAGNRLLLMAQAKPQLSQRELQSLMGGPSGDAMEEEDDDSLVLAWLPIAGIVGVFFNERDEDNNAAQSNPAP